MSTIDNRIVRMQFDNAQFEAGVARSMTTLDKLNEKLQFKDAEKGTSVLQRAMEKIDLSKVESMLDTLTKRFSTLGTAWGRVVEKMVDKAVSGLKGIEQATIGQIKSGGWSRAMNLANAQFTIEGLKMDWQEMNKAISYGVQDTAYGLDAAAKAAASLAASGVDYKESMEGANDSMMHTSLRAISGVAAMTNSSYEDISRIFTTVAGQGKLMAEQLNSLAARGMNAAATLGEQLHMTEADVRAAVSKGKIDFETFAQAMDNAFGEHAKEANKTFQGSLSNMKAALSRIGAIFATPVIGKTNILFLAMKDRIGEVQKALSDLTQTVEVDGKKITQVVQARFATHFAEAWEAAMEAADHVIRAIDLTWIQKIANAMDMAAQRATFLFKTITGIFERVKGETKKTSDDIGVSVDSAMTAFDIFFNGKYGNGSARIKALKQAGKDVKEVQSFINDFVRAGYKVDKMTMSVAGTSAEDLSKYLAELAKNGYKLTDTTTKLGESVLDVGEEAEAAENFLWTLSGTISNLWEALKNLGQSAKNVVTTIANFGKAMFTMVAGRTDLLSYTDGIADLTQKILSFTTHLKKISQFDSMDKWMNEKDLITAERIIYAFRSIVDIVSNVVGAFRALTSVGVKLITEVFKYFASISSTHFLSILDDVNDITSGVRDWAESLKAINKLDSLGDIKKRYNELTESLAKANSEAERGAIQKQIDNLVGSSEEVFRLDRIVSNLGNALAGVVAVFRNVGKAVGIVAKAIAKAFVKTFNAEKVTDGVVDLSSTFVNLSDALVTFAEKAAPAIEGGFSLIFTAAQAAWKIITKVSESITRFISNILSGNDATGELVDTVDTVGETAKETKGFFDVLLDIFTKFADGVAKIPEILDELFTKLSENEGVIRLKNSIGQLWDAFKKGVGDAVEPFANALGDISETDDAGNAIDTIVDVVGWLADKLAMVIEKIPSWITTVENFAKSVKESIVGMIDSISKRIDDFKKDHLSLDSAFTVSDEATSSLTDDTKYDKILKRVQEFTTDFGKAVKDGLKGVNWKEVAGIGIMVGAIMELYQLSELTKDVRAIPKSVSSVFGAIKGTFKGITGFLTEASKLTKYAGISAMVTTVVASIVVLAGAIVALGYVPREKLEYGIAVLVFLGVFLGVLIKLLTKLNASKVAASKVGNKSQNVLSNNTLNVVGTLTQVALLVASIGGIIYLLAKSMKIMGEAEHVVGSIIALAFIVGIIGTAAVILAKATSQLVKQATPEGKDTLPKTLRAMALMLIGISVAVLIIAEAMKVLSKIPSFGAGVAALVGVVIILGAISGAVVFMAKSIAKMKPGQVLSVTALIFVMALAVAGIAVVMSLLAGEFAALSALKQTGAIIAAIVAVTTIVLAIGGAIWLIGKGISKVEDPGSIVGMIFSMVVLVGAVGIVIGCLAAMDKMDAVIGVAITLGLFIVTLGAILGILATVLTKMKVKPDMLTSIGLAFVALGVGVLAIAGAMAILTAAISADTDAFMTAVTFLGVFLGIFAILAGIVAAAGPEVGETVLMVGGAFALLGAGVLLAGLGMMALVTALNMMIPIMPVLLASVEQTLIILENHWPILLGIGAAIVIIVLAVTHAAEVIIPVIKGILEVVVIVVKGLMNFLGNVAKVGAAWFKNLSIKTKALLVTLILSLCSALLESGPQVLQTIGTILIMVIDFIISAIPMLVDKLIVIVVTLLNSLADSIIKHAATIAAAIWSVIGSIIVLISEVLDKALKLLLGDTIGAGVSKLLGLQNGAKAITNNIREMRENAEKEDEEYGKILSGEKEYKLNYGEVVANMDPAAAVGFKAGKAAGKALQGNKLENEDSLKKDFTTTTVVNTKADTAAATNSGEELGDAWGAGMEGSISDRVAQIKGMTGGLPEEFKEYMPDYEASGEGAGNAWGTGMFNGMPDTSEYTSAAGMNIDGMAGTFESRETITTMEDATNAGIVEPTVTSLEDMAPQAKDATSNMVDGMIDALWDKRKVYQGMFRNQYVVTPVKQMVGKDGWDERSPSHVFYDIAAYAVKGLSNGFTKNAELVTGASSSLADKVVESFGDPLAYIGAMANGDIEYDPSIRPVLDSSSISASAGSINSMFNDQNVSLSGLSGRLAADLGEVTANNADIVDELVALRADMAEMTERMSNLQVVMNSGALVGAIAGDMDSALGQRTVYKRRGN